MKVLLKLTKQFDVKYLQVHAHARYPEDATVNGVEDEGGKLMPFWENGSWNPKIDIDEGRIVDWPEGISADIHYKVCDAGQYKLLTESGNVVRDIEGYVPDIMCPDGEGYGDYIMMEVDHTGKIQRWEPTFDEFSEE